MRSASSAASSIVVGAAISGSEASEEEGSLSPAEAEAWAGTDEGRSFYRGAADGWAVAHVASGADPAVAQQRSDATYGFYTGTEA